MRTQEIELSPAAWRILACPACRGALERVEPGARCAGCGAEYRREPGGALSLHPPTPMRVPLDVEVGAPPLGDADLATVTRRPRAPAGPPVDPPRELTVGNRLTARLTEHLPRGSQGVLLDLGCGDRSFAPFLESVTGLDYVGMDFADERADLLGDAHALPFADGSAALVTSFAVFEHVAQPWLMAREVRRVLRPGGVFVGTLAFLEPYHMSSHAH